MYFICFNQKTAYELRISAWSSDVCSSDLGRLMVSGRPCAPPPSGGQAPPDVARRRKECECNGRSWPPVWWRPTQPLCWPGRRRRRRRSSSSAGAKRRSARSEEHTSELQSLMRISYAVFCLKKNIIYHHIPS